MEEVILATDIYRVEFSFQPACHEKVVVDTQRNAAATVNGYAPVAAAQLLRQHVAIGSIIGDKVTVGSSQQALWLEQTINLCFDLDHP